jgi:hypothetical protein
MGANNIVENNYQITKIVENNLTNFQMFTTYNDKHTQDVFEISDPFEFLLPQYFDNFGSKALNERFSLDGSNLLNLISTSTNLNELLFSDNEGYIFQPDFDSLSSDVKEKLKSGDYKIGESKKIDGNKRAVIVDINNSNQRVEDITFKEVAIEQDYSRILTDLAVQAQLKKIYEIAVEIKSIQEYQLEWDRNNSILPTFFTARSQLIEFHNTDNLNKKIQLLQEASRNLEQSVSAIKTDLNTNKNQIKKLVNEIQYNEQSFERHANFILDDLTLLLKIVGMQTYIDLTLDNEPMALDRIESVRYIFADYSSKSKGESRNLLQKLSSNFPTKLKKLIPNSRMVENPSLLEIIHDNYRYNDKNKDLWLKINNEMQIGSEINFLIKGGDIYED